jgi:ADYC domain-containing protein
MSTSLRRLIWFGAIVAAGCGGQLEPQEPSGDAKPQLFGIVRCQDPTACNLTNGTGVYFEEQGSAGIGPYQALITHFINNNGLYVSFQARVNDPTNGWVYTTGMVDGAVYNGVSYNVTAIGTNPSYPTYPSVTLKNAGGTITVWGYYFSNLQLNISLTSPVKQQYALTFGPSTWGAANYDPGVGNSGHFTADYKWDMQWRDLWQPSSTTQPYCKRAPTVDAGGNKTQLDDSVVFQSGIDVDPQTGHVFANANDVTMSCRYGAPATAYWWGYDWNSDLWHFAAAIHMKRASYCGDAGFHTVGGTKIDVQDETYIEGATSLAGITIQDTKVEAFWGPNGAICYNQPRRPDLKDHGVTEFGGSCGGNPLPRCDTWTSSPWYYSVYWAMWYAQAFNTNALTDGVVAQ